MISKAMLMAAGLGTRLQPFTHHQTKALLPVLGVPIAQLGIDSLVRAGVQNLVANIHHDSERTRAGLLALDCGSAQLDISDESKLLLGSAGGLREALPKLGKGPFFLANADVLCDVNWLALAAAHQKLRSRRGVHMTLAIFRQGPEGCEYREILYDPRSELITGLGSQSVGCPFFIGAAVIEPEALSQIPGQGPAEFVPTVLEPAVLSKKAGIFLTEGSWYDIGSPSLWLSAHLAAIDRLETGFFPSPSSQLWQKRWEATNLRVGQKSWIALGSPRSSRLTSWAAPFYWDGRDLQKSSIPWVLGPNAVLYGQAISPVTDLQQGIGFAGEWVRK
jgi:MurNAc alpha-1-phosphate uridylyltransferase